MTNCFCAHLSVIFVFISFVVSQLGKQAQIYPPREHWNSSSLEYIHYSLYILTEPNQIQEDVLIHYCSSISNEK